MNPLATIYFMCFLFLTGSLYCQLSEKEKSTKDLSFLIGTWQIERVYGPETENPRTLKGMLVCNETMDGTFIKCTYKMERPGKIRGIDEVYFNYNSIYDLYESLWLSSTWPIKVLMQGDLDSTEDTLVLKTNAKFLIQNGVTEYVKGELSLSKNNANRDSFYRKTHIRTSKDQEDDWYHHMNEYATKIKG